MKFSTVAFSLFVSSAVALPATQQVSSNNNGLVVREQAAQAEQAEQACLFDKLFGFDKILAALGQNPGKRDIDGIEELVARATKGGVNINVAGTLIDGLLNTLTGLLGALIPLPASTTKPASSSTSTVKTAPGVAKPAASSATDPTSALLKQLAGFAGFTGAKKRELAQGSVFSVVDQLVAHIAQGMPEAQAASIKLTEAFNELQAIAQKQTDTEAAATEADAAKAAAADTEAAATEADAAKAAAADTEAAAAEKQEEVAEGKDE